jgi:hypothetical protein
MGNTPRKRALTGHMSFFKRLALLSRSCSMHDQIFICLFCQAHTLGERFWRCDAQGSPGVASSSDRLRAGLHDMERGNSDSSYTSMKDSKGTKGEVEPSTDLSSIQSISPSLLRLQSSLPLPLPLLLNAFHFTFKLDSSTPSL